MLSSLRFCPQKVHGVSPKNATYINPDIQNELISLCASESRNAMIKEVKQAKFFAIIADDVSDVSNWEQVALVLPSGTQKLTGPSKRSLLTSGQQNEALAQC